MTFIHIKKKKLQRADGPVEVFAVPAVAIASAQGKKILIPNPAGNEACTFNTLEEAEEAVKRAGFDYIFEGKKTYTYQKKESKAIEIATQGTSLIEESIPILIERLRDREASVVANAAFALGELRAIEAIEGLSELLGHDDASVRKEVAEALAKIGSPALPSLKRAFKSSLGSYEKHASHIRLTVMTAYLEITYSHRELVEQIIPQVIEGLKDDNWLVRAQASSVIGHAAQFFRSDAP